MSTEPSWTQPWQPQLNWSTPAGKLLDRLIAALPPDRAWRLIVFGSAPLQLAYDPAFISADVDLIPNEDIQPFCEKAALQKGASELYIDPCSIAAFTAAADWTFRSFQIKRGHVDLIFPHPIDLLAAKVARLEEKDLRAFELVRAATHGHPTEQEALEALRRLVDIFKPSFDEEKSVDVAGNARRLWGKLYDRELDVAAEIIRPALAARREAYGAGGSGMKNILGLL